MTLSPFIHLATGSPRPGNTSGTGSQSASVSTGEKPQSKVWNRPVPGLAFCPTTPAPGYAGLMAANWTNLVKLTTDTKVQADVKTAGDLVHVLLFDEHNPNWRRWNS